MLDKIDAAAQPPTPGWEAGVTYKAGAKVCMPWHIGISKSGKTIVDVHAYTFLALQVRAYILP